MDVEGFLAELRSDPAYRDQIVHVHEIPAQPASWCADAEIPSRYRSLAPTAGIERFYRHQGAALRAIDAGRDVVIATGTASGKTICYALAILQRALADPDSRSLLLFPTKALCQDQYRSFAALAKRAGLSDMCGVLDGDTPGELRRRLRDQGRIIFSNPDMVHAAMMPQHARWSSFLGNLSFLVLDELHVYNGIFGSNMAWALSRLFRLCSHYGATPRVIACSATIANPGGLAQKLLGRSVVCIRGDGSPRGRRLCVFWNPPRIRNSKTRSRRSANVEAHELMVRLVRRHTPVITFSKAKMTAEMIHRYVVDSLRTSGGGLAEKVAPYRGGYLPRQRRALEKRLFSGELLGVSATPALELGIDIGALEASIIVGYPGTLSSFLQQAGRAGRGARDSVVFLVGLDTSVNQYIMHNPAYIFDRCVEEAVIDPRNPHVLLGQLRCAAHELPIESAELARYGPCADLALRVLNENHKIARVDDRWYHAAAETPQHEVSLRSYSGANVVIRDIDTGEAIGEIDRFDAEPILHPEAIYMHQGQTFRVLELDLDRNRAAVRREDTDYYTQPLGGTDIHHIDNRLREKRFGSGMAYWGEVTAHFNTYAYEKIHFYSLDALSVHGLDLPVMVLETMALWIVAPEDLMAAVRKRGMDVHAGLRGIGYATRMALPLFITCDTLDFSHTIGSVNAPWNAIFIYERYPLGLGFTEKAYERLHEILPAVYDHIVRCRCRDGCPCCVGKPLRGASVWNVERGEAHIPNKSAALAILEGLLGEGGDLMHDDSTRAGAEPAGDRMRTEDMLRRRLERMREPCVFHPITPLPHVRTATPPIEERSALATPDVARRSERRRGVDRTLHKRIIERIERRHVKDASGGDSNGANGANDSQTRRLPTRTAPKTPGGESNQSPSPQSHTIALGDSLAARARTQTKRKQKDNAHE